VKLLLYTQCSRISQLKQHQSGDWRTCKLGFNSKQTPEIFLFSLVCRQASVPTQSPIHWAPEALPRGLKESNREFDHSPPSGVQVENVWIYTSTDP